jgi:hypothetical protein
LFLTNFTNTFGLSDGHFQLVMPVKSATRSFQSCFRTLRRFKFDER